MYFNIFRKNVTAYVHDLNLRFNRFIIFYDLWFMILNDIDKLYRMVFNTTLSNK